MPEVNKTYVSLGAKVDQLKRDLAKGKSEMNNFGKSINSISRNIGTAFAAAFSVRAIINFTKEASRLAAEAEGVSNAFNRIGSVKLLDNLRKATRGTVSDLELMRKAVQANNFDLPLSQLSKLFEFASRRAQETGESVDYLVNSIVLGIGRKSPLILDNLGISAVKLRQKLKGVGVETATVGDITKVVAGIAVDELEKMGDAILTSKDYTEQLTASWQNFKVTLGDKINPVINTTKQYLSALLDVMSDKNIKFINKLGAIGSPLALIDEYNKHLDNLAKQQAEAGNSVKDFNDNTSVSVGKIKALNDELTLLKEKLPELTKEFDIQTTNDRLEFLNQQLERLNNLTGKTQLSIDIPELGDDWIPEPDIIDGITTAFEKIKPILFDIKGAFREIGEELLMIGSNSSGIQEFASNVVSASKRIISAYLGEAVAGAMKNVFAFIPFPFNLLAAKIAGGAVASLFNSMIPAFGDGGIVTHPTIALIGEKGPERIEPIGRIGSNNKPIRLVGELTARRGILTALIREETRYINNIT